MIYRNQIMHPSQMSTNYMLNKQRKQKYQAHLNKIFEIQTRQFQPKLQAKLVDQKIIQLTKLKQFARNFKAKQQQIQRLRKDLIMVQHIKEIKDSTHFPQPQHAALRKTKSTMKFNSRVVSSSISSKNIVLGVLNNDQVVKQNKRLIKSITENSFDEDKFRKTLKESTQDYLKVRSHMRRVKGQRHSLKKLKTQPAQQTEYHRACPTDLIYASTHQQNNQQDIRKNLRKTYQTSQATERQKSFKKSTHRKKMFAGTSSLTQIIDRKLNVIK